MKFLDFGTITTTGGGLVYPKGDGAPQAIGAATITLPTSAVDGSAALNFYQGYGVVVIAGQGAGQQRSILNSTTAYVCTVAAWDSPRPDTGSTVLVGTLLRGRDGVVVKMEGTSSTGTGTFRGVFYAMDLPVNTSRLGNNRLILSANFSPSGSLQIAGVSSSAGFHLGSQVLTALGENLCLAKIAVEVAPTGSVEVFMAPMNTRGRMGQW